MGHPYKGDSEIIETRSLLESAAAPCRFDRQAKRQILRMLTTFTLRVEHAVVQAPRTCIRATGHKSIASSSSFSLRPRRHVWFEGLRWNAHGTEIGQLQSSVRCVLTS